ncbi:ribosome small subunit-dependent GTPase A [Candidatus Saccharibacteria bacterium]|nr:ribosome small subunit-dependent GTPase A [Candidatus Saccharibacteria bacterium]
MQTLTDYGWNEHFAAGLAALDKPQLVAARVLADYGSMLKLATPELKNAELSGALLHAAAPADLPKVGDWVAVQMFETESAVIEAVLPRRSDIARKAKGSKTLKQVMAANVDVAFVLQAMNDDFNAARLQRYLYQLSLSHIRPVVVLNKADQAVDDINHYIDQVEPLNVEYIVCSALYGDGAEEILRVIAPGETAVLLGSSGVGKSTLTNALLGSDIQKVGAVREHDQKGRHTTSHRELFTLIGGGMLIDTPGIRELQLWGDEEDLDETFEDVFAFAAHCKYSNCKHGSGESGCAIQAALKSTELDTAHYRNFLKMSSELKILKTRINPQNNRHRKKSNKRFLDD